MAFINLYNINKENNINYLFSGKEEKEHRNEAFIRRQPNERPLHSTNSFCSTSCKTVSISLNFFIAFPVLVSNMLSTTIYK